MFTDFLNIFSILYYVLFASFIVFFNDLFNIESLLESFYGGFNSLSRVIYHFLSIIRHGVYDIYEKFKTYVYDRHSQIILCVKQFVKMVCNQDKLTIDSSPDASYEDRPRSSKTNLNMDNNTENNAYSVDKDGNRVPLGASAADGVILDTSSYQNLGITLIQKCKLIALDKPERESSGSKLVSMRELGITKKDSLEYNMILKAVNTYPFGSRSYNTYTSLTSKTWGRTTIYTEFKNNSFNSSSSFGGGSNLLEHIRDFTEEE